MEYRFKITQQPASRLEEFPFSEIAPGSSECFFVPDAKAGLRGSQIRYFARKAGVRIKLRRRFFEGEHGYFVWVRKPDVRSFGKVAAPQPDAVSVSGAL